MAAWFDVDEELKLELFWMFCGLCEPGFGLQTFVNCLSTLHSSDLKFTMKLVPVDFILTRSL